MADAYCKVHGNTPEADRPKPAIGEWTAVKLRDIYIKGGESMQPIASAINAALDEAVDAAEQEILVLQQQLAAERREHEQWLAIQKDQFSEIERLQKQLAAKQQELEATAEVNALLQNGIENRDNQLAAEREKVEDAWGEIDDNVKEVQQLREQLSRMELELQRSNAKCAEKASQLAAAQAAIIEATGIRLHDRKALNAAIAAATSEILKQAHEWREMWEASEAAQKPLVDGINEALQRLSAMEDFMPSRLVAVGLRHALSNMKEGK
jgi:DNA repair exonuclease SbcCD ATPase subunit